MKEQFESNDILNSMFDLSNIDFKKCHEFAMSNLSKEVCDYYNDYVMYINYLKKLLSK